MHELDRQLSVMEGRKQSQSAGKWQQITLSWKEVAEKLLEHRAGTEDGRCWLQGSSAGGHRGPSAMIENHIIALEFDNGLSQEEVIQRMTDLGNEAIVFTRHDHLSTHSNIEKDTFMGWAGIKDVQLDHVKTYLSEVKGIRVELLNDLKIVDEYNHTQDGIMIKVSHDPIPKFRAVMILAEPFKFQVAATNPAERFKEWKERCNGLATLVGARSSPKLVEPSRLFHLPRRPAQGPEALAWAISGLPIRLENVERVKFRPGAKNVGPHKNRPLANSKDQSQQFSDAEEQQLLELNASYAVVKMATGVRILCEPRGSLDKVSFISLHDFKLLEAPRTVLKETKDGTREISMAAVWIKWPQRRHYNGVVFEPSKEVPGKYNLWRGWTVNPVKGDWSLLQNHIFENLCEGKQDVYEYLLDWAADILHNPTDKKGVSLLIHGEKGTGKTVAVQYLQKLLAPYQAKVSNRAHLTGNFNAHLESLVLLTLEEGFWAGDKSAEGILKDFITSDTMQIERKGSDVTVANNYARLIMISNEYWMAPASFGDERRYFALQCGNNQQSNSKYFAAIAAQMAAGGLEAMMYDLLHRIPRNGTWESVRHPPENTHLLKQQVASLTGIPRFMYDLHVNDGNYECRDDKKQDIQLNMDKPTTMTKKELRSAVDDYMTHAFASDKQKVNFASVCEAAKDWFGAEESSVSTGGAYRTNLITFPPLREARKAVSIRKKITFPATLQSIQEFPAAGDATGLPSVLAKKRIGPRRR
ncbi:MAG: primase-helicase family protein [Sphingomicrobium sp.]